MPLSARERLPFELASNIISQLAIGDIDNIRLLRQLFPRLNALALIEARKDPIKYLGDYFVHPRGILNAMLLCNAHIYGPQATEFFVPSSNRETEAIFNILVSRGAPTSRRSSSKDYLDRPPTYHLDGLCFNTILFFIELMKLGFRLATYLGRTDAIIVYDTTTFSKLYIYTRRFVEIEDVLVCMPYSQQMSCLGGWGGVSLYHDFTRKLRYFQNKFHSTPCFNRLYEKSYSPNLTNWEEFKLPYSYYQERKTWRLIQRLSTKFLHYRKYNDWKEMTAYAKHQNISTLGSPDCKIVSFTNSIKMCPAAKYMAQCTAERLLSTEWLEGRDGLFGPISRESHMYSQRLCTTISAWRISSVCTKDLVASIGQLRCEISSTPCLLSTESLDLMLKCEALSEFWNELKVILQHSKVSYGELTGLKGIEVDKARIAELLTLTAHYG